MRRCERSIDLCSYSTARKPFVVEGVGHGWRTDLLGQGRPDGSEAAATEPFIDTRRSMCEPSSPRLEGNGELDPDDFSVRPDARGRLSASSTRGDRLGES